MSVEMFSRRSLVKAEGSGPDVVLIPGLNSSPRVWAETVKAVPGYRYHLVQISGLARQAKGGYTDGPVALHSDVDVESAHIIMWDQAMRFQSEVREFLGAR